MTFRYGREHRPFQPHHLFHSLKIRPLSTRIHPYRMVLFVVKEVPCSSNPKWVRRRIRVSSVGNWTNSLKNFACGSSASHSSYCRCWQIGSWPFLSSTSFLLILATSRQSVFEYSHIRRSLNEHFEVVHMPSASIRTSCDVDEKNSLV